MRSLVAHVERAFPQDRLPTEEEIEEFIDGYETVAESDRQEAALIRNALVLPFDRHSLTFATPDYIFYARGNLLKFMFGTYLLTFFDGEVRQVGVHDRQDYMGSLLHVLWVSGPTWPYLTRPDAFDKPFVQCFADFSIYQCCVVAECMRHALNDLEPTDKWHTNKALETYWGVFPPMSIWPDEWST